MLKKFKQLFKDRNSKSVFEDLTFSFGLITLGIVLVAFIGVPVLYIVIHLLNKIK